MKPEREFHLLALLGSDLPGAVTVTPLEGTSGSGGEVPMAELMAEEDRGESLLRFSLRGRTAQVLCDCGSQGRADHPGGWQGVAGGS